MPTYEYECNKCEKRFEKFQSMIDKPIKKCPMCGGRVERLIGAGSGIIFKGSGFYANDYKNKSKPAGENQGECPNSKTDSCKNCPSNRENK